MHEQLPDANDDDAITHEAIPPTVNLIGRLCWIMLLLVFMNGIMCNLVIIVYLFDLLFRGVQR